MFRLEVEVPINLLAFDIVIIPLRLSVLAPPMETTPKGDAPPAKVVVPFTVVDEDKVTEGVANEPLKLLEKFKLFTMAGNKLPVVCAAEPLKVKLVLLFAPLLRLNVPAPAKVPFTPPGLAVTNVAPFIAPFPNILTLPEPLITEVAGAVTVVPEVFTIPILKEPGEFIVIVVPLFRVKF